MSGSLIIGPVIGAAPKRTLWAPECRSLRA